MKMENCLEETITLSKDGKIIANEVKYDKVTIREITGFDEEVLSTDKFKNAPAKMLLELVTRCIVEIPGTTDLPTEEELKALPSAVVDEIIFSIRKLTLGTNYEFTNVFCPSEITEGEQTHICKAPYTGEIDISGITMDGDTLNPRKVTLARGIVLEGKRVKSVTLIPTDMNFQTKITKLLKEDKYNDISTELLFSCVKDISGKKVTRKDIQSMVKIDRNILLKEIDKIAKYDFSYKCTCSKCKNTWEEGINILDFLL